MNTIKANDHQLRLKRIKQGPRLAIRRLLRSFEPLEKPPPKFTKPNPPK